MLPNEPNRLWGGRFRKSPDPALLRLSNAPAEHLRLAVHDIAGSRAHARELERAGILTASERADIDAALVEIAQEISAGGLVMAAGDEDVHSFLERVLIARLGPLGAKLRAGRSRNDQAANDLKLYLRASARRVASELIGLATALADLAEPHAATVCPGFTHLQPAQPVTFGHVLLAHAQPLMRDLDRLADFDRRTAVSPLGAAALAGSALALRPDLSAAELGYAASFENSIDAVAARDHVAEFLFVAAMIAVDVSRLAEEVTLWASRQFGWAVLDDAFATGSSIMPQKKNPDIAELARGRAARLVGDLVTMLGAIKGLPLAYNRDLGEDKRAAFDAVDVLVAVLPAMAGLVASLTVKVEVLARDAAEGFTLATEVADHLALAGVPFAEAHEIAGALVRYCEEMGLTLEGLDAIALRAVDPRLGPDLLPKLSVAAAVVARSGPGGTAPERVREQVARLRARLASFEAFAGDADAARMAP